MEEIEKICRLAIISSYIEREQSVSIILCSPPEHGKSETLKRFSRTKGIHFATNFDAFTFNEIALRVESEGIRTLMIPDFLQVSARRTSTKALSIAILNALTAEGWHGTLFRGQKLANPIKLNVITATTREAIEDGRTTRMLRSMGFLSRFIPVSFSYAESTKMEIRDGIKQRGFEQEIESLWGKYKKEPKNKIWVDLPLGCAEEIEKIVIDIISERPNDNPTGFRLQKQLQTLAMANAICRLKKNPYCVSMEDVEVIRKLSRWMNFNYTKV